MASDFFTICGYDVTFIGANTPESEIVTAVQHIRPLYVGISVSNYYHLVAAHKMVAVLSSLRRDTGIGYKIIMGGSALECNPAQCKEIGADMMLQTYDEIKRFCESERQ